MFKVSLLYLGSEQPYAETSRSGEVGPVRPQVLFRRRRPQRRQDYPLGPSSLSHRRRVDKGRGISSTRQLPVKGHERRR